MFQDQSKQYQHQSSSSKHSKIMHGAFFFSILACLGFYVFSVNGVTSDRFLLQELRARSSALELENYELSIEVARIKSIGSIEQRAKDLNLEEVKKISYIKAGRDSVLVLGN